MLDLYSHIPVAVPESVSSPRVVSRSHDSISDTTRSSPHTPSSVGNELEVAELARSIEESFEEKRSTQKHQTLDSESTEVVSYFTHLKAVQILFDNVATVKQFLFQPKSVLLDECKDGIK